MSDQYLPKPEDQLELSLYPPATDAEEKPSLIAPAILFLVTFLTTLTAGFFMHINFVSDSEGEMMSRVTAVFTNPMQLLYGLPFCFTILVILLAHEMGHYLTCRFYGIKATLPYVIPAPPPFNPFGTFGAVIKIKSNFRDRRQLFDVGVAGPLAGFIFIIPALLVGLHNSKEFEFTGPVQQTLEFGEPLLFRVASALFYPGEAGTPISLHPVGWAAWFGMLATSINLLPFGQLDGGHMVYALLGARGHRILSGVTLGGLAALSLYSWPMMGYLLFVLILIFIGFRHPRPYTEFAILGRARVITAIIGLIIFVLTFIPVPVQLIEQTGKL